MRATGSLSPSRRWRFMGLCLPWRVGSSISVSGRNEHRQRILEMAGSRQELADKRERMLKEWDDAERRNQR